MEDSVIKMVEYLPGMQKVVGSNPRGGRNFSHGKLSRIEKINKPEFNITVKV